MEKSAPTGRNQRVIINCVLFCSLLFCGTLLAQTPCVVSPPDLVSWWQGGGNASDRAGANHGTLTGNVSFAPGRVGLGFVFEGNGDAVRLGNPANLWLQDFSIEAWIQRASASSGGDGLILSHGSGGYGLGMDGGGHLFLTRLDVNGVTGGNTSISDTGWHHVAVTKIGSAVVFYVDGLAYPAPLYDSGGFKFTTGMAIGARGDNLGNSFLGTIDELTIYHRTLSAAEIRALYNAGLAGKCTVDPPIIFSQPTSQTVFAGTAVSFDVLADGALPVSYQWIFNDTNIVSGATNSRLTLSNVQANQAGNYSAQVINAFGSIVSSNALLTVLPAGSCLAAPPGLVSWWPGRGNALDRAGANHGTLTGNVSFGPGRAGLGFVFDGSSDAVRLGNPANLWLQDFTIEAWIQRASASTVSSGGAGLILSYGSGGYGLGLDAGGHLFLTRLDVNGVTGGNTSISDTSWHHVAVTKTGSAVVFYLDGLAYPALRYDSGGFTFSTGVVIGARGDSLGNSFLGTIDELTIYQRSLSAAEIQTIHNAGSTGKCTVDPLILFSQPTSQTVFAGTSVSFHVLADSAWPVSYQWIFNDTNIISGATNASLAFGNVQMAQAGNYSVQVTDAFGSILSSNALLTVSPAGSCLAMPPGLVSWWPGRGNALDRAGANHGTLTGNVGFAPGRVGLGFVFDGNGDAVLLGNPVNMWLQDFSIEAWIQRASASAVSLVGGDGLILSYGSGGYGLGLDAGGHLFLTRLDVNGVTGGNTSINDTSWHHVAVTKTGSAVVFYVDGVAYPVPPYNSGGFTFSTGLVIGARGDSLGNTFLGTIDELTIYQQSLSAAEIQLIYNAGSTGKCAVDPLFIFSHPTNQTVFAGADVSFNVLADGAWPVGYQWIFNGTNVISGATNAWLTVTNVQLTQAGKYSVEVTNAFGSILSSDALLTVLSTGSCWPVPPGLVSWWPGRGNASDAAGSNHGTLKNDVSFAPGRIGLGFVLDGIGAGVELGNPASLQLQDFTIEAWTRRASASVSSPDQGSGPGAFVFSCGYAGYGFGIFDDGSLLLTKSGFSHVRSTGGVSDTNWHHVAVTKSGSTVIFYIDGAANVAPAYDPGFVFSTKVAIGVNGDTMRNGFFWSIDELAVYSRALSANEIQAIYNASASGKCAVDSPLIVTQPTGQLVFLGSGATLSAVADGPQPVSYQWLINGTNVPGATNSTLNFPSVATSDGGT